MSRYCKLEVAVAPSVIAVEEAFAMPSVINPVVEDALALRIYAPSAANGVVVAKWTNTV